MMCDSGPCHTVSCNLVFCCDITHSAAPLSHTLLLHSVNNNGAVGEAAQDLAKVVLEHGLLTDFGGIPMSALRENSLTELDLNGKGVGVPGALVLAKLLPAATALKSCRCAPTRVGDRSAIERP